MRILIAAGGTGGHVYPALAVAEAILDKHSDSTLFFVGSVDGFERPLIEASDVQFDAYDEVQAGPLQGINPLKALVNLSKHVFGIVQSMGILRRNKAQVVLTTGGWVSFPVSIAAWLMRIPVVIYLPDIEPGLTIKVLRRFATKITTTTEESAEYLPASKMVVTGYPLRKSVLSADRQTGIEHFQLDPQRKTLFITGGSRGARSINIAVIDALPELLKRDDLQVVHITGTLDHERANEVQDLPHYYAYDYLHDDMGLAYAAADLAICRAGASTIGELPHFALPSILVPYPYAWRYQKVNADYLAARGAAIRMDDEKMATELIPTICDLLDHRDKLQAMSDKARQLAHPDAAERIGQVLLELAGGRAQ